MTEQEMLKEALEWQEHIRKLITATDDELYHKRSKVFDWLIKQAERVEALEEENDELAERVHKLVLDWLELVDERNHYKQALEFYADEENYCVSFEDDYEPILQDNGDTARQALGWEENK
jgi:hypothetical protein